MTQTAARSTDAVACRVSMQDADLIRRAAASRGQTVSALLRGLLAESLAGLRADAA